MGLCLYPFHYTHMSHETLSRCLMNCAVHHWVDILGWLVQRYSVCVSRQLGEMCLCRHRYQPMACCWMVGCVGGCNVEAVLSCHEWRASMSDWVSCGLVWMEVSAFSGFMRAMCHVVCASGCGQSRMC